MQEHVKPKKRAVNLTIDTGLFEEAKAAGLNFSEALRSGIEAALQEHRLRAAREEHRPAIEAHNRFVEKHGLLSDEWRKF